MSKYLIHDDEVLELMKFLDELQYEIHHKPMQLTAQYWIQKLEDLRRYTNE